MLALTPEKELLTAFFLFLTDYSFEFMIFL